MGNRGTTIQNAEGVIEWEIKGFRSLEFGDLNWSPQFSFAGGDWKLWIRRDSPKDGRSGGTALFLRRKGDVGPPFLDVEYTFSVRDRNGDRHGERNRKEFGWGEESPSISIELEDERMPDLVPDNTLTVLCHLERIDPTQDAGCSATSDCSYCGGHFNAGSISSHQGKCLDKPIQCPECSDVVLLRNWYDHKCRNKSAQDVVQLKEKLQQKTAELAEKQSEIVRLQRLNEELNLKVIDLEAYKRHNTQNLPKTGSEGCGSGSSSLLQKNKVLRDYKDLFHKKEEVDVVLRVQGQEFPAHRNILMARSPVFASTFRVDMREKATGVVEIEDCDPSSFADFLCYLYCGAVENLSSENAFNLFAMADKYDVQDLRSECLEFLKEKLSVDTFCDTITLALRHSETDLLLLATNFFTQNAPQIIVTVKWQQFSADNPTQSNELFVKLLVPNKNSNS